jgi:hydrogenase maturation protease
MMLVVGLGNPILTDDGVGWHIAQLLRQTLPHTFDNSVEIITACVGGLSLAELLIGYHRAVIADAIITGKHVPGTIQQFKLTDLPGTLNSASTHDTSLKTALQALRRLGVQTPSDNDIYFITIEALDVWTFAERCSPLVWQSIPLAVNILIRLLQEELSCLSSEHPTLIK